MTDVEQKIRTLKELNIQSEWRTQWYEYEGWKFLFREPGMGIARKARSAARVWHPEKPVFTWDLDVVVMVLLPMCTVKAMTPQGVEMELSAAEWKEFWVGKFKGEEQIKEPFFADSVSKKIAEEGLMPLLMAEEEYKDFLLKSQKETTTDGSPTSTSVEDSTPQESQ